MTSRTSKRRIFFNFLKNFFNKSVFKKSFYATFLSLNVLKSRFFLIYFAFGREKKLSEGGDHYRAAKPLATTILVSTALPRTSRSKPPNSYKGACSQASKVFLVYSLWGYLEAVSEE